jgi:hypothetical protein
MRQARNQREAGRMQSSACFDHEDGGNMFLWNVGYPSTDHSALFPRRWNSSKWNIIWYSRRISRSFGLVNINTFLSSSVCVLTLFKPASTKLRLMHSVFVDLKLLNGEIHLKMSAAHLFCFWREQLCRVYVLCWVWSVEKHTMLPLWE